MNRTIWKTEVSFDEPVRALYNGKSPRVVHFDMIGEKFFAWVEHDVDSDEPNDKTWIEFRIVGTGWAHCPLWEPAASVLDYRRGPGETPFVWHLLVAEEPDVTRGASS